MEMACANAIDQGRHDDVSLNAYFQASPNYREVSLSLTVWLFLVAHLFVGIDVFIVGEDAVFGVFAGDWLIAQVGCARCLLEILSVRRRFCIQAVAYVDIVHILPRALLPCC